MPDARILRNGALDVRHAATSQSAGLHEDLPEPLEVVRLSLGSAEAARDRFPGYRLTRLVEARVELDEVDMGRLSGVLGIDLLQPVPGVSRPFHYHLRQVIARYDLSALFRDDGHTPYHHAIRPTGYDFYCDEVIPVGMEQWRADYRDMSDERQMIAASIVWLYRAGKDNIWLRRVPSTWHAADAIACLNFAGGLVYPGEENIDEGCISILTPVGAALLGLSEGQSIEWETLTGESRVLTVLRLLSQS